MRDASHKIDSVWTYLLIFVLLMALLAATVFAATMDLGRWNGVTSLVIAGAKAILVILFFMHVRHSAHIVWVFAAAAFLWLGLLLMLTMADYGTRDIPAPGSAAQIAITAIPVNR